MTGIKLGYGYGGRSLTNTPNSVSHRARAPAAPAVLETVLENGEQVLKANVASTPRKEECT